MKIGRKNTLLISTLIGIVGVCLEQIMTVPTIVIGRTIYGLGTGIYSVCVGRYVEETAPP
jgi:MFS family permease